MMIAKCFLFINFILSADQTCKKDKVNGIKELYFHSLKVVSQLITLLLPYFISILCRSKTNINERIMTSLHGAIERSLKGFALL